MQIALWLLGILGHVAFCVAVFNRLHALNLPKWLGGWLEKLGLLLVFAGCCCWIWLGWIPSGSLPDLSRIAAKPFLIAVYALLCVQLGCFAIGVWMLRRFFTRPPSQLVSNHTSVFNVPRELGHRPVGNLQGRILDRVPWNQMLDLHVHEKTLGLPRLPQELDGFTIAHLSDLHFTGKLSRDYFEFVRDRANEFDADLVAVTGDIVDAPDCIEWITEILGNLQSRLGGYFILGNHEKRLPNIQLVRDEVSRCGLVDLGNAVTTVSWCGCSILLAGNERPWFPANQEEAELSWAPADFRILLSHSPDQINWARRYRFDLMLAGHTHGGQIRLPAIGPVVSPSSYGVQYAAGTFYRPPTLMHVSRGISSQLPLRINCPPELTKLTLRRANN